MQIENQTSRSVEAKTLTGRTAAGYKLEQLTDNAGFESQHTYYDICPWSHDQRAIVFSRVPVGGRWVEFGHDTLACPDGRVCLLDTETNEIREVAGPAVYMRHGGAYCMWNPAQHKIYYRKEQEHYAGLDLATGDEHLLPGRIRQLSPDGNWFALMTRPAHGGGQGAGVGVLPEAGGEVDEVVTREQLHALTPNRDQFTPEDMLLGNTKWHPDGEHLLIAMWVYPVPDAKRSIYVVRRDGGDVRWLCHFGGHHSWTPDGSRVLFVDEPRAEARNGQGRFLHTVNFDGSDKRQIFDQPAGSHPLLHPDNNRVVDFDKRGVYMVHLDEQRIERLVDFTAPFDTSHHGTHAHPVWNHTGDQILFNSAETGHSEVYRLTL